MSIYVGKPIPRYDGIGHVTGRTIFVDDITVPGMLYIKVLRSPVHKGVIRNLDISRAENLPGVAGIVTARDIPGQNSVWAPDQPVLVDKNIRYMGERIAAVAAVDEDTAMEAVEQIKLDIEEQTPVFDPIEAMKPGAPKVRPEGNLWQFNSGDRRVLQKGDVEKGFQEADEIVEQRIFQKSNNHAAMEPHVSVAYIDENGRLKIHTVSQAYHFHLSQLCAIFNLPISKVCMVGGTVGGGFGGKNEIQCDHITGLMALKIRRPVKYRMTRKEVMLYSTKRGAFIFDYKCGVKKNGLFAACKVTGIHDMGAYNTLGDYAVQKQCLYLTGPYNCPNVRYDGFGVFTNKPVSSSMRGFAIINVTHASEIMMNLMAEAIGMDPWEIRFINAWREGDTGPTMWRVTAAGLIETMKKAAEMAGIALPDRLKAMSSGGR
jgi:CO/xanthine dehydrogenase Mo-binding subunit